MFTAFNSESLWIGTDLKRFNEIRDVLDRENIKYKYKVKDQLGEWTGSGTLRGRVGSAGNPAEQAKQYAILVDKKNLEQSIQLCRTLSDRNERLDDLDAAALLEQMDRLEREGTTFLNKQVEDTKRLRYIAPAVVTVLTVALMAGLMALMIWGFTIDAEEAPPLPLVVVLVAIPGVIILGVLLALIQRVQEIEKGEVDDAKKY